MGLKHHEEDLSRRRGLSLAEKSRCGRKLHAYLLEGGAERTLLRRWNPPTSTSLERRPTFPLIMGRASEEEWQGRMEIDTKWLSCSWNASSHPAAAASAPLVLLTLSLLTPHVSETGSLCRPSYPRTQCHLQVQV